MMRMLRGHVSGAAAVVLAGSVLLGAAAPSLAVDEGTQISHVEVTGDGIEVLLEVPADVQVDLDQVAVSIDDEESTASAQPASGATRVRRSSVLAIDVSNSMQGQRFEAAQDAARAYLDAVPADVEVGIVTFAGQVTDALAPTTDREAARQVVDNLTLSAKTKLYDGVLQGVDMAGTEGQRTLLVLSDGADTSGTDLTSVIAAISGSGLDVDVVSLEQTSGAVEALQEMADAGGGEVISADSEALAQTFSDEADILARQVLVSAEVPASVTATEASVEVTLPSDAGDLSARSFVPVRVAKPAAPAGPAVAAPEEVRALPDWIIYAGIGAVGVGLLVVLGIVLPGLAPTPLSAVDTVSRYTSSGGGKRVEEASRSEADMALAQATGAAESMLARSASLEERISKRLGAAGSSFKPAEWVLVHGGIAVAAAVLGMLLGGGSLLVGMLFLAIGIVVPWLWLGILRGRRVKAFNASLPDTLQLISGSLAAGLSLAQSVDTVVREGTEPIASEFKRVLVETRLGVSLEDALEGITERFDSKDFAWVVMAIRIQRQVGGNLSELLNTVAGTIREREYLHRQVAALSAEGRLSAWVLGGLPPLFFVYLLFSQRDYVDVLYTTTTGWMILGGAAVLLCVGAFAMSKLTKVEV